MQTSAFNWSPAEGWTEVPGNRNEVDLVLYFGLREALADGARYGELRNHFPAAHIIGCSTGGQIQSEDVSDDVIAGAALSFEHTSLRATSENIESNAHSNDCGRRIGDALAADDLAGIFILSDGLNVNGSALVEGMAAAVGHAVPITGGLAGDGASFEATLVGCDEAPGMGKVAAVGFYGDAVRIGHGSAGGWDIFGPRRKITRSDGNVLYELDGKPALDLYKRYLGDEAEGLPGTGLLFPLSISDPMLPGHDLVRTILAVNNEAGSMTFAGDMPEGWSAQLMRGSFERLADGAAQAARKASSGIPGEGGYTAAAILVSCIGRRLLMGQRIIEEVRSASQELGNSMVKLGFYSYGEISPHVATGSSELHNQTMTATVISEIS